MGTWAVPFTEKQANELRVIMSKHVDVKDAAEVFYNYVGDDGLFDLFIDTERKNGSEQDSRAYVMDHLQTWFGATGDSEQVRKDWNFSQKFEPGALDIIRLMLTDWHLDTTFPKCTELSATSMLNGLAQMLETDGWDSLRETGVEIEQISVALNGIMYLTLGDGSGNRKAFRVSVVDDE